jgi:hypothetical protein
MRRMEVAFGISWPKGQGRRRILESPLAEGSWTREGSMGDDEVLVRPYELKVIRQAFDITMRVSVDNMTFETVVFRNISLVAGRDMGFAIEVQK